MDLPDPGKEMREAALQVAAARAIRYLADLETRGVGVSAEALARLSELDEPLPEGPSDPAAIVALLDEIGSAATTATAGGRFFGYVVGGSLPAALAANWLAAAWDQDGGMASLCPINATLEEVTRGWLLDVLGLPPESGAGFVTGGTMANFTALAAARHAVLAGSGLGRRGRWAFWSAAGLCRHRRRGPRLGCSRHSACSGSAGSGSCACRWMGRDGCARTRCRGSCRPAIVCLQAGNVNTGACDPAGEICARAHEAGAWVHVDGAFGLWAAAAPSRAHLVAGVADADSWAIDAHKWLNVPYDSGIAFVRDAAVLRAAMGAAAPYLASSALREPDQYTPEMSRRARGVEVWAALRSLGRSGLADLIERCCRHAARFAAGLEAAGYEVLNEVVLNQVLVSFGTPEETRRVIAELQADGTCWCGGTTWQGRTAMRISVSSWATTDEDVEQSLEAMIRIAARVRADSLPTP